MNRSKPKPTFSGRTFSKKQINNWIKADNLTKKRQKKIKVLINRLP